MIRTRNGFMAKATVAVVAGRVVNEEIWVYGQTRKQVEKELAALERINAEMLAYVAEVRAARLADAKAYLERRAARTSTQLGLGF